MKSFIKNKLNEAFYGNRNSSKADLYRTEERIASARAFINSRPLEERKYWETITHDAKEQGFRASAVLNKRGDIQIKTYTASASDASQHQFGVRGEEENTTSFFVSAHPGIDHPGSEHRSGYAKTKGGITNITLVDKDEAGSPASDAQIKAYAHYGEVIMDFIKQNPKGLEAYTDGSGSAIANEMDPREKLLKLNKDLKNRLRKNTIPPTEWERFLNALRRVGIDLQSLDFRKDLVTDEQWDEVLKVAKLKPTMAPKDDEAAYKEKLAAMDALKARHRRK
jgi:hypothetical protein